MVLEIPKQQTNKRLGTDLALNRSMDIEQNRSYGISDDISDQANKNMMRVNPVFGRKVTRKQKRKEVPQIQISYEEEFENKTEKQQFSDYLNTKGG